MSMFGKEHDAELGMSLDDFFKLVNETVNKATGAMDAMETKDEFAGVDFEKDMESLPF